MRPVNEQGAFSVATDFKDGKVRVVVTAVDKQNADEFVNFLSMSATAVGPDFKAQDVVIRQVSPGRYVGEFASQQAGNYFITVNPGQKPQGGERFGPIRAGVSVPYSSEYRERETNLALLKSLASLQPRGGETGTVLAGKVTEPQSSGLLNFDTFRHTLAKAISSQDAWQWLLVLGACLFFGDVFVRRVAIGYETFAPAVNFVREKILRRERPIEADERLARLRSKKAEAQADIDERRAAARFDPQPDNALPGRNLDDVLSDVSGGTSGPPQPAPSTPRPGMAPGDAERDDSYTSRLLEAKKKAKRPDSP
jgi:hypothetical protein